MTVEWDKEKEPFKVGDKYRKSNLSLTPGGVRVFVKYKNGFVKVYDKIKYPNKFIEKIHESKNEDIVNIWWEN
tara:strand:- start:137 stop:355 length:219 start_codon:yes stop_codon:yes gene_type:complete